MMICGLILNILLTKVEQSADPDEVLGKCLRSLVPVFRNVPTRPFFKGIFHNRLGDVDSWWHTSKDSELH